MKIIKTNALNGPNYWSNARKKLIVVKIDLEQYEQLPTDKIPNFATSLQALLPSLYEHRCSPGEKGGLFKRMAEGTWLGHVIEHVALELQWLAGMPCGFGRTFGTSVEGVYQVIFSYEYKDAGLYAADAAVDLVKTLAEGKPYLTLEADIAKLQKIARREGFGPSTQSLITEINARDIPCHRVSDSLIILGHGAKQKRIWASVTSETNVIGVDIAGNKELTKQLLAAHFIPVPEGYIVRTIEGLEEEAERLGYPVVVKPTTGNHGCGITTNIQNKEALYLGFQLAKEISDDIMIERFITGDDYRILLVNYKVVAVSKRTPAHVVGDGKHSVEELIQKLNDDPRRGEQHDNFLSKIEVDALTHHILKEKGLTLTSILPEGTMLYLKTIANISMGGTATDMTDDIHPSNKLLAERIARLVNLDICGIDLISNNIRIPLTAQNGAILEVNSGPGLRMHLSPNEGKPRNVAKPIIDMLFPEGETGRIPVIAVTGTNGKTTVVMLSAKLAQYAGKQVGYTTTEGVYLNQDQIHAGDCSGPVSARVVLNDPAVDFAVLECARGGILKSGLGFDECDISIITNITSDHLGIDEINTLDELARLKSVVARSTKKTGYAILNAEDDMTYGLKNDLTCHVALFARTKTHRIEAHCAANGLAIYLDEHETVIIEGKGFKKSIINIRSIPITFNGKASCMVLNILPVILAGYICKFPLDTIEDYLKNLAPRPDVLPGRMNIFNFPNGKVMIDYAHNEGAYKELQNYVSTLSYEKYIGVIGVAGDRRDEDIIVVGKIAGQIFDEIIIRHDVDGRTRTNEEITNLLLQGINANADKKVSIISDELEAIAYAMNEADAETFIFCGVEDVHESIKLMNAFQKNSQTLTKAYLS